MLDLERPPMEITWAIVLGLVLLVGLVLTVVGLPGNWLMVLAAGVYWWLMPPEGRLYFGWPVLIALFVLALVGEILEFITGAMGAKQAGGSKRAAALAIVGSVVAGLAGLVIGTPLIPIPVVGSLVGLVLLGALGAMAGAILGETWKGRTSDESWRAGVGAFRGRLLGTLAKMAVGLAMVIVVVAAMVL
jgi:uncharacterized protein